MHNMTLPVFDGLTQANPQHHKMHRAQAERHGTKTDIPTARRLRTLGEQDLEFGRSFDSLLEFDVLAHCRRIQLSVSHNMRDPSHGIKQPTNTDQRQEIELTINAKQTQQHSPAIANRTTHNTLRSNYQTAATITRNNYSVIHNVYLVLADSQSSCLVVDSGDFGNRTLNTHPHAHSACSKQTNTKANSRKQASKTESNCSISTLRQSGVECNGKVSYLLC